mgnify:CR=1 FL=1
MARITVEDCLEKVPNLFQLVLVAAKRARQLANGAHAMVDWENDKPTVVALREIAEGHVNEEILTQRDKPVEDLLAAARWPDSNEPVLVVGHQPTLGVAAAQLLELTGGLSPAR